MTMVPLAPFMEQARKETFEKMMASLDSPKRNQESHLGVSPDSQLRQKIDNQEDGFGTHRWHVEPLPTSGHSVYEENGRM